MLPEKLNLSKKRKILEVRNALSAQDLAIYELIVGTSRKVKGKHTMWLLVMSQKKKKLLSQKNF
jgi:hypothetical protein